ncbi:MAG TPA: hypothetical protein VHQ47_15860 [Phycisphaerae bacterium]|nr:hypothetical protein [Phycisphaerae bacterium]
MPPAQDIPRAHVLNYVTAADSPTHVRRLAAAATAWISWAYLLLLLLSLQAIFSDFTTAFRSYFSWTQYWQKLYDRVVDYNPAPVALFIAATILLLLVFSALRYRRARLWIALLAAFPVLVSLFALITDDTFAHWEVPILYSWKDLLGEIHDYITISDPPGMIALAILLLLFLLTRVTPSPIRRGRPWAALVATSALLPTIALTLLLAAITAAFAFADGLGIFLHAEAHPRSFLWLLIAAPAAIITLLLLDILRFLAWIARNPLAEKTATPFLPRPTPPNEI